MTTVPLMSTEASDSRIASTARRSAASLLPLPCSGAAASAPASVTRSSSRARLRLIFGSSITECETLADAAPPDRQFVRLDPQVFLARETTVAAAVDIDAGALEHGGDADLLLVQHGVKSVDQELVFVELDLAQPAETSGAHLGRQLQLRAGGFWPRACDGFLDGPLEELTPEFSDSPDRAWRRPQRYDRRLRRHLGHALARCVGNAFGVNSDHPVVNAAFLDDQGSDRRVSLQPAGARDLQPVAGDHVAPDEAGDRDPGAPDIGLHLCLGTDQEVTVALDLPAEVAQHLPGPPQHELAGQRILARQHRLLRLENERVRSAVGACHPNRFHRHVSHVDSSLAALLPSMGDFLLRQHSGCWVFR